MKEKTYYLILVLLLLIALAIGYFFEMNFKYWIGSAAVLVIYIWSKVDFTGKRWFEKPKPKPTVNHSQPVPMTNEVYEKYGEETYPVISEQEKNGYILLTKLCLAPQKQNETIVFFEKLKDYSHDEDYMATLNYVMEYADKQELFFLMSLDWKEDIETLEWRLKNSLKKNFNLSINLPNAENYDKGRSVSFENVFEDYDKLLRNQGLQMGFIDTQSDEYVIFVHKTIEKQKVENAVNKIGYKYYEK